MDSVALRPAVKSCAEMRCAELGCAKLGCAELSCAESRAALFSLRPFSFPFPFHFLPVSCSCPVNLMGQLGVFNTVHIIFDNDDDEANCCNVEQTLTLFCVTC